MKIFRNYILRIFIYALVFLIILSFIGYYYLESDLFSHHFSYFMNKYLEDSSYEISYKKLQLSLFGGIDCDSLTVKSKNDSLFINTFNVQGNILNYITSSNIVRNISVKDMYYKRVFIEPDSSSNIINTPAKLTKSIIIDKADEILNSLFEITINRISIINADISFGSYTLKNFRFDGGMSIYPKSAYFNIHKAFGIIKEKKGNEFVVKNIMGTAEYSKNLLLLRDLIINAENNFLNIAADIDLNTLFTNIRKFDLKLDFQTLAKIHSLNLPIKQGSFNFEGVGMIKDNIYIRAKASAKDLKYKNMDIYNTSADIVVKDKALKFTDFLIESNLGIINTSLSFEETDKYFNADINSKFYDFRISELSEEYSKFFQVLDGYFSISSKIKKSDSNFLSVISPKYLFNESNIKIEMSFKNSLQEKNYAADSIDIDVSIKDKKIFLDKISYLYRDSKLFIKGKCLNCSALTDNLFDFLGNLDFDINNFDLEILNKFFGFNTEGIINGNGMLFGKEDQISFEGSLVSGHLKVDTLIQADSVFILGNISGISKELKSIKGYIDLYADDLTYKKLKAKTIDFSLEKEDDFLFIKTHNFDIEYDNQKASGRIYSDIEVKPNSYRLSINNSSVNFHEILFTNIEPIEFLINKNIEDVKIDSIFCSLKMVNANFDTPDIINDEITISGNFKKNYSDLNFNFDIHNSLVKHFALNKLNSNINLKGNIDYKGNIYKPDFSGSLSLKNIGSIKNPIDSIRVNNFHITTNDSLIVKNAQIFRYEKFAEISGSIPINLDLVKQLFNIDKEREFDISFESDGFPLDFLQHVQSILLVDLSYFSCEGKIKGKFPNIYIDSNIDLDNNTIIIAPIDLPVKDINGKLEFINNTLVFKKFVGKSTNNQPIFFNGSIDFSPGFTPTKYNLSAQSVDTDFSNIFYSFGTAASVYVRLTGDNKEQFLDADISVEEGSTYFPFNTEYERKTTLNLKNSFTYRIHVEGEKNIWLRNEEAEVEISPDFTVYNYGNGMYMSGNIDLIRGTYYFLQYDFELIEGEILFNNKSPVNPNVNIHAQKIIQGEEYDETIINLFVTGQLSELTLEILSDPPLEKQDILTLLMFNMTYNEFLEMKEIDKSATIQALNFLNARVSKEMRRIIGIDDLDVETEYTQGLGNTFRVTVGQYITKDIFVEYSRNLSTSEGQRLQLKYFLNKMSSILSETDERGNYKVGFQYKLKY